MYYDQEEYPIKFEWGLDGLCALLGVSDIMVIVDVLSFSSCVDIATSRGAAVYPYQWKDESAVSFATERAAILAEFNRKSDKGYTLSPKSLLNIPMGEKIVLPSPNGSTLSLSTKGVQTVCGCLRNAKAVADFCRMNGKRISVIAAGERWNASGNLRVAFEDLLGAGAILAHLGDDLSPEAQYARIVFENNQTDLHTALSKSSSGKELIGRGFKEDVMLASKWNESTTVPVLLNETYVGIESTQVDASSHSFRDI